MRQKIINMVQSSLYPWGHISIKYHSHYFKISFLPLITYLLSHVTKGKIVNTYCLKANNLIITNTGQFLINKVKNRPFI